VDLPDGVDDHRSQVGITHPDDGSATVIPEDIGGRDTRFDFGEILISLSGESEEA